MINAIMIRRFTLFFFLIGLTMTAFTQSRSLNFYLNEGIRNSPLLNDYSNQISASYTDSLLVRANKKPQVEARSMLQYSPVYNKFGYDEVITDGGNYMAVMGVTQNILNKKELTNKFEAVDLQKKYLKNASRISTKELNRIITDQYLISYSNYSDFMFNNTFLELFEKENEIVKEFVKNGICKQTDYLSLLVEKQSQEILTGQLKSQYRKELMILNQLCGLNDSTLYELGEPEIIITGTADIKKVPAYIQYKIDSIRIENEKMAVDIRYKPKINWFADAGILTSTPWNFYKHVGYSAGLSLNIPVYDGRQKELEKHKLDFNENSRKVYESNYSTQYYQHIQQLNIELKSLNVMSERMENQLKTSDLLLRSLKEQLEAGIIQMTEYINAIKNFKSISRTINLVNIQKLQVINELNFLLTQ